MTGTVRSVTDQINDLAKNYENSIDSIRGTLARLQADAERPITQVIEAVVRVGILDWS